MQRWHNYKINCGVKISKEHCRGSGQDVRSFCENSKNNRGGGGSGWGGGGQGGCGQRIEFFVKIKKKWGGEFGSEGGWGVGLGGQGGYEQRIEIFVNIQKKLGGGVR